ncbi:MAG: DHA2 family efflux MFS transporter permease subunit [Burkholderiales bacterium]
MNAAAAGGEAAEAARPRHPLLITFSVMLATMLYSIDWTIAAVALPHMRGTFSATQDQIGWVITSYIVASAIMMPTAGFLSTRFGRKRVFLFAMSGFIASSVVCGAANSIEVEVAARIVQGMSGAFLVPLSQAIILDTYPPAEQGKAMALWGLGSVFGPVIGPTLGGYLTELMSWRAIFYINLPVGLLALAGTAIFVPETKRDPGKRLDWFGFLALAAGIGALQLMLDRGERLDWFSSHEIVIEAGIAALGLYLFTAHILTAGNPFLSPRLFADRNYAVGLVFIFLYGLLTVPTMVLMPPFMQDLRGFPIDTIGLLQSPRGIGLVVALLIGGRVTGRMDPRILIAVGLAFLAVSSWEMARWNLDVGAWPIVWTGFVQGAGAGILLVPIQAIAFPALPPHLRTEAAAVFNLTRSVGSSMGVSIALTLLTRETIASHARLVEHVTPYNENLRYEAIARGWDLGSIAGLSHIEREIGRQASMLGYAADFRLLAFGAFASILLLLLVRRTAPR